MVCYVMDRLTREPLSDSYLHTLTYVCQDGVEWTYQAYSLEDAHQACQAVADGPLHWTLIGAETWAARDRETGTLYQVEHLPF